MKRHRSLGGFCLIALPLLGLLIGLGCSPLLAVREIAVEAPTQALGEQVARLVHVPADASVLFLPLDRVMAQARSCPQVLAVTAQRVLPHRLVLTVTARAPFATLQADGGYTVMSRDGVFIYRVAQPPPGLPVVVGLTSTAPRLGGSLPPERLEWLSDLLSAANNCGLSAGVQIDFTNQQDVKLATSDGLRVTLGDINSLARKVTIAGRLCRKLRAEGSTPVMIDVSTMETPIWRLKHHG